ncbi:MAG: hypothetical protein EXX96DRAFT_461482, partial [Benjaminiella poitrasii]
SDFHLTSVYKLKKKMVKNKCFVEISIYLGMIELLAISGYVFTCGALSPFLGSSVGGFGIKDEHIDIIYISLAQQPYMNIERLLKQYFK